MKKMSLYYMPSCPYCVKVLNAMRELDLEADIELRDKIAEPKHGRDLKAATGIGMVPCLRIQEGTEDRWMHESSDIVAYLRTLR